MYAHSFVEVTKQTLRFYRSFRERKGLTVTGKNRPSGLACDNMAGEHTTHAKCEREETAGGQPQKTKNRLLPQPHRKTERNDHKNKFNNQRTKRPPKKRALGRLVRISEVEGWSIVNKFTRTSRNLLQFSHQPRASSQNLAFCITARTRPKNAASSIDRLQPPIEPPWQDVNLPQCMPFW